MNSKRLTIGLAGLLSLLLISMAGSCYLFSSMLKKQSLELATNKAIVSELTNEQTGAVKSKRDIATYSSLHQITKSIVPQDKDQAATVREITNIAATSKVTLTTITFPSSTLGSGTVGSAANAAVTARPNLSQLTPVKGLAGVYNLQINLGNNAANPVTYNQLTTFLRNLENNRRTAAVSSINIQPQTSNPGQIVFTLIINTYIKP